MPQIANADPVRKDEPLADAVVPVAAGEGNLLRLYFFVAASGKIANEV